jgi:hypothetical protein
MYIALKSVRIPTSITKIDDAAFRYCEALSIVVFELPSTVIKFGSKAFAHCISLESVSTPRSLVHIGEGCFEGDECLSGVIFESQSQLTSMGNGVFQECPSLSFFYIPPRLQILDRMLLAYGDSTDVEVDPESQWFSKID